MSLRKPKPKLPMDAGAIAEITHRLGEAVTLATVLMTQIDDGDVSAEMQRRFSDTMLATKQGIEDARKLDDAYSAILQQLQWEKSRIDLVTQRAKDRQRALKERIKQVVASNPQVVFRDRLGTKVYVKDATPSLKFSKELATKTVSNVVGHDFPLEYTEPVTFRVVNRQAVRDALARGERLDFAWLEQGQSLCGL